MKSFASRICSRSNLCCQQISSIDTSRRDRWSSDTTCGVTSTVVFEIIEFKNVLIRGDMPCKLRYLISSDI